MCKPGEPKERRRVIISGAGPAGLLCASLLLSKNKENNNDDSPGLIYDVTLIDRRQDFGALSEQQLKESFRSWMISLTDHGLGALREIPDLYDNYVKDVGILIEKMNICFGTKIISQKVDEMNNVKETYIVDRNFICAAIARFLRERFSDDDNFTAMYHSKVQYVDYENKQVLVRKNSEPSKPQAEESYLSYDLLIGCDGIRSTVREALIKRHSDFTCEVTDIFQEFKAVHIDCPPAINHSGTTLLPNFLPKGFQGILLPERGGKVNVSCGVPRNCFSDIDEEMKSGDYTIVSAYLKKHFKAFALVDYDDFAKQWVAQRWNQSGMVHCNYYHSVETSIVLMGDAAHATSPLIGRGMNTALRDAQAFDRILDECKHDLSRALPAFSEERVKEGNALSDLAYYLNCIETFPQIIETLHLVVRSFLNRMFPSLVMEHPMMSIIGGSATLSDCYDIAIRQGIIQKHRYINDRVRRDYFEKTTGMVKTPPRTSISTLLVGAGIFGFLAVLLSSYPLVC